MICNDCRNTFISGTCLTCGVHRLMDAERESCRAEGRREMLWLMAIGAVWQHAQVHNWRVDTFLCSLSDRWLYGVPHVALRVLADLGDEQAREMLR